MTAWMPGRVKYLHSNSVVTASHLHGLVRFPKGFVCAFKGLCSQRSSKLIFSEIWGEPGCMLHLGNEDRQVGWFKAQRE